MTMLCSYSQVMRSDRRQRRRITSCTSGLALVLLLAASHSASAFCMPRSRVRSLPAQTLVRATTERSQLEFEQRKEEEKDDDEKMPIANGQNSNSLTNNGKDRKNGECKPQPLSALCTDSAAEEEDDSFEIHVGRALDTLRSDYPHMLTEQPGELRISNKDRRLVLPSILVTDTHVLTLLHS